MKERVQPCQLESIVTSKEPSLEPISASISDVKSAHEISARQRKQSQKNWDENFEDGTCLHVSRITANEGLS